MKRLVLIMIALASGAIGAGLAVNGCGGCVRENRTSSTVLEPPQACLQLDITRDQSGILFCGDNTEVGGVNHCSDALTVALRGALAASAPDAGNPDGGGAAASTDQLTFASGASVSFSISKADAHQDPDGTLHWDLPARLGAQPMTIHLTAGPQK